MADDDITLAIAGWSNDDEAGIVASPHITLCGGITDGIALRFGTDFAAFVVSFADLERLYMAAKAIRDKA